VVPEVVQPDPGPVADAAAPAMQEAEPAISARTDTLGLVHEDAGPIDHLGRARELEQTGDYEGAIAECRRAEFDEPGQGPTLELLGRLASKTFDHSLAGAAFLALAGARPDDAQPLVRLARARLAAGDPTGTAEAAGQAIARDASVAEAHHLRGLAHLRMGDLATAIGDFRKAVALSPNHGWAQNNLGYALLQAGKADQAREPLERAAALLPDVAYVQNNLGLAYEKAGMKDQAEAAYTKALELRPKYVKAKVNSMRAHQVAQSDHSLSDAVPISSDEATAPVVAQPRQDTMPDTDAGKTGVAGRTAQTGQAD
jgi:Flp pilus assembly protein TadD